MDFVDNSNHMCLICNQTIVGLLNYVEHFKTHATPKESHIVDQTFSPNDVKNVLVSGSQGGGSGNRNKGLHLDRQQQTAENAVDIDTYSGDTSPMSEFIDNTDEFTEADIGTDALLSPKHCSDFFQSLELKSANEDNPPRPRIKAVQRLSILEDDAHAESLLPITSILSNLEFSSDDDFIGVSDNEEEGGQEENFWLSDDGDDHTSAHPPHGHTGGKWRPGEGPKPRMSVAGNLKLGYRPGPACRKNILKKPCRSRGNKNDIGKTFYCNVCLSYFADRNAYSLHFSQSEHKNIAEAKKQEKITTDYLEESQDQENISVSSQQVKYHVSPEEMSQLKPRRGNDGCHCPVCNLYFDNAVVFSTHCDTKLHKDAMLKRGFREYKGNDGIIIRINVHNETISKDKQENVWSSINNCRPVRVDEQKVKEAEDHSCRICQKHFTRKYEMARHLLTRMHRARALKHPEAESVEMLNKYNKYMIRLSPFQCGICQYYFNRQRDFLDHMGSSSHVVTCEDMLGAITCVACRFQTHRHSEMMEHLQYAEHLAAVEKRHGVCIVRESHTRITCKFCGVRMHSAVRMKRHCQKRHRDRLSEVQVTMDIKPVEYHLYRCPLCEKTFRAKSLLQLHFLKIHKNTSLFNCLECNRGFLDQRRLDNHLRTRFHAKRVVANKIKGAQFNKVAALKKAAVMNGLKKRGRGRPRKDENIKTAASRVRMSKPVSDTIKVASKDPKPETAAAAVMLRRSTRKRKTLTFFSDEEPFRHEEVKEKRVNGTAGAARLLRRNIKITQDKINKLLKEKSGKSSRASPRKVSKQPDDNMANNSVQADVKTEVSAPGVNIDSRLDPEKIQPEAVTASSMNGRTTAADCLNISPMDVKAEAGSLPGNMSTCYSVTVNGSSKSHAESDEDFAPTEGEEESDGYSPSEDENYTEMDEEKINEASKYIFSCTYCEFAATDLMELRSHYNESHPNDILTCQPCSQYFLSLKAYKIHCSGRGHQLKLREQSGETKMHKCKICGKRFLQESCCLLHMETIHRHPSCEADLQRIHKGQDLVTQLYGDHVKQVESLSNDTSVSCPECGKFVRKDTLVEHLRLHTGERPYACRFCSKGFAGRLTLRRHISSHLNMPLFMCHLCGKEFKRNSHLIKHIRQHDFEKKGEKHTCHVCKAWFYTPEELIRHMRRHGDRNYKCTWPGCHWTFVLSGELKSHMFTHTGEKKYLCDMCGFGAPTKTRLRRHVKTHDKSRNFTCDYCPYKATCKTHLKRHMRIHINAKPFACPYCNYICNTHENIRKHILKTQKHKGMKLYPCRLCGAFGCDSSKEFRAHLMTVHASYLRENAIDSLAVFSGLYRREEDFQKPQEGSEILQVTKGRFFRSYQNPNAPIEPPKPKKIKKVNKMEEVKVNIVPPSELESEDEMADNHHHHHVDQHEQHHHQEQQQDSKHHITPQPMYLRQGIQQGQEGEEALVVVENGVETPHYIEVPNMVIHSYDPQQVQQLAGTTVSFTSSLLQHQHHHLQQQQPQPLPVTVTVSDDNKFYWTLVPEQRAETTAVPVVTAEPWYSGMPQVHAPTSQDLQHYRPIEVSTSSHAGQFLAGSYFSNIPLGDIQNIPNAVAAAPIYTRVGDNVVLLSDPTRSNGTSNL
ncbi:unnamed protein product [Candidula unifasciata]|uniref:C2H2-type domain-containing protein n=1 Tax=Candidula unifasciata TaxID=100452 RepID=A0A8S3ZZE0_9EUPU|nr:unnamed protein product [Candidula unifasciata]